MADENVRTDAVEEGPKTWLRFKEHQPVELPSGKMSEPPPQVEIGNGDYRRVFRRDEQPFGVTLEEAVVLKNTGLFEDATEPPILGEVEEPAEDEEPTATGVAETPAAATRKKRRVGVNGSADAAKE
jgi:hypothetical protein